MELLFGMIFWPAVIIWWVVQCRQGKLSKQVMLYGSLLVFGLFFLVTVSMARRLIVDEPLFQAASEGDTRRVETLLSWSASPNMEFEGTTVLQTAARNGNVEVVRVLLAHGADTEVRNPFDGHTVLGMAKANGHVEVVRLLRDDGARE